MATPWSFVQQGPRPAWAPPPFRTPFAAPVTPFVPGRTALNGFPGGMPAPALGPVAPGMQQPFTAIPVPVPVPVPTGRKGKQSQPQSGPSLQDAFMALLNRQGPLGVGSAGQQGPNQMRIAYGAERAGSSLGNAAAMGQSNAAGLIYQGARGAVNEVKNAFDYLTATPNSDLQRAFNAMIQQESGGRQSAVSNKGAIGVAQVMPGTGPEAAKLAGLPWDPVKYKNDPQYNAAIGFAYFKEKVRENNGDVFKGMAAYNAGQGRVQQAERQAAATGKPWTAFLPQETQQYIPSVLSKMGALADAFGAPPPAFNAAPYQNAMAAQDQIAALASKPFNVDMQYQPLPERPKPDEFQAPDFSAGNQAFAAAAPVNPFDDPKEQVRLERQQYWKGLGQAMASLSGGEGIGTMLMKLGAGALMGRARGQELIDAKEEQYQKEMQQYNLALAQRNDSQAAVHANVLNQNLQQRNQYAEAIWQDNIQQISKFQPQVQGDKLITFTPDPNDPNKKTMTVTPLGYGPQMEAIMNKANIGIQLGQAQQGAAQFAYQHQQTSARTALGLSVQMATQQGNPQATAEGYLAEAANRARATVRSGTWRDLFGNDTSNLSGQLDQNARMKAYQSLGVQMRPDGSEPVMPLEGTALSKFNELYEDNLTANIYEMALKAGTVDKLFTMSTAHSAYTAQRGKQQRESQRTDSRGRTSFTTSWDMGE